MTIVRRTLSSLSQTSPGNGSSATLAPLRGHGRACGRYHGDITAQDAVAQQAEAAQVGKPRSLREGCDQWQVQGRALMDLGGIGFVRGGGPAAARGGTLKVVTTNLLPGYIRKNGVPYSANAVLTEYLNRLTGAAGDTYLSVTAMVEDSTYLNQPFLRTYTFKSVPDGSGWEPTPCWPR